MITTPAALLEGAWFTAEMPPAVRARLAEIGELATFAVGATIVAAGEPCPVLGVIAHGRVALRPSVPGVARQTILTLEDGEIFGWSAVLQGAAATSTAVAVAPTTAVIFDRGRLERAMAADCELALAVHRRVLLAVARRLQATRLQLLDLYRSGPEPW